MKRSLLIPFIVAILAGSCLTFYIYADAFGDRTDTVRPGSDIMSAQAYAMWESDPDNVIILDVRSQPEYALVGHPPMAYNIPLAFWTDYFDTSRRTYSMKKNPDFINQARNRFPTEKTILVLCRSGQRSDIAAKLLKNAGFTTVHNIADGFDGQPNYDRSGVITGNAGKTGWRNSGLPWTYSLDPELVY